ncbi:hypothetical protein BaRGS_00039198 [Batillaria attramentaria]|uniref:Uncharacterized protein n=1 Tax=Batillaria attramentaria TaxID=370345 RepID=A0ABD0J436_9CAEN
MADNENAQESQRESRLENTGVQLEEISSILETCTPPDVIVQKQLRDVILIQSATVEHLHQSVTGHESFMRDHLVSKEEHFSKLKDLEAEQQSHAQTKLKLMEVTDKLDFTLGEVEILNKQMAKEKETFQQIMDSMRSQIAKGNSWNEQLDAKYSVSQKQCQELEARLATREATIASLEQRLASQQKQCERKIEELEVERQQDQYVARMLDQPKNSRTKNTSATKLSVNNKLKR